MAQDLFESLRLPEFQATCRSLLADLFEAIGFSECADSENHQWTCSNGWLSVRVSYDFWPFYELDAVVVSQSLDGGQWSSAPLWYVAEMRGLSSRFPGGGLGFNCWGFRPRYGGLESILVWLWNDVIVPVLLPILDDRAELNRIFDGFADHARRLHTESIQGHEEHEMRMIYHAADEAWTVKDLGTVARLLSPVEGRIDALHRRRFEYARKRC